MVFDRYLMTNIIKKVAILYLVFLIGVYWLALSVLNTEAVSLDPAYEGSTPSPAVSYCGGGPGDGRTYCRRNCTSYVAYKLAAAGVSSAHYQHNGNGKDWDDNARAKKIPVGSVPKVGSVAYWNSGGGGYGHVGWVDSVNADGSVNTSNYNGQTESFYTQNSARPEGYIYFSNVGQAKKSSLDFNSDGKDDIAWYQNWNSGRITGLMSSGTSFSSKTLVSGMGKPTWAGTGDFNGDKRGDVVWYHESTSKIYILSGTPEGGYGITGTLSGMSKPDWAGQGFPL